MDDFYTLFVQKFKLIMDEQSLTDSTLGRALGKSHTTISNIKNGKSMPSVDIVAGFIMHTGVNADWLLMDRGDKYHTGEAVVSDSVKKVLIQAAADLRDIAKTIELHGQERTYQ